MNKMAETIRVINELNIPEGRRYLFSDDYHDINEDMILNTDDVKIGTPVEYNGKLYSFMRISPVVGFAVAHIAKKPGRPSGRDAEEITCPYCGHEYSDSWDRRESSNDEYCSICGGTFSYERIVDVTYRTRPVKRKAAKKVREVEK
jgi:hypothetical protein